MLARAGAAKLPDRPLWSRKRPNIARSPLAGGCNRRLWCGLKSFHEHSLDELSEASESFQYRSPNWRHPRFGHRHHMMISRSKLSKCSRYDQDNRLIVLWLTLYG